MEEYIAKLSEIEILGKISSEIENMRTMVAIEKYSKWKGYNYQQYRIVKNKLIEKELLPQIDIE